MCNIIRKVVVIAINVFIPWDMIFIKVASDMQKPGLKGPRPAIVFTLKDSNGYTLKTEENVYR